MQCGKGGGLKDGETNGLVASLKLCMGCFVCEVACKQEHNLPKGKKGIKVVTLGPYEIKGKLSMDFVPLATEECDLCADRMADSERPFCAQICPAQGWGFITMKKFWVCCEKMSASIFARWKHEVAHLMLQKNAFQTQA